MLSLLMWVLFIMGVISMIDNPKSTGTKLVVFLLIFFLVAVVIPLFFKLMYLGIVASIALIIFNRLYKE